MRLFVRLPLPLACLVLLAGCAPFSATPGATRSASSRPTAKAVPSPARLALSDTAIAAPDTEAFFLFQAAGDARLRGVSWDGSVTGLFTQSGPSGLSSQSPDGRYAVLAGALYDRQGRLIGSLPWPGKQGCVTWSPDGTTMCKAVPLSQVTGSPMRLQLAAPGAPPRTAAMGFVPFSDNASFPVLACDPKRDRAIVAEFGQGVAPTAVWIIRLSTATIVRTISAPGTWIAVSSDASLVALTSGANAAASRTSIESADDGTVLGSVNGITTHGFSGDGSLLVSTNGPAQTTTVLNWRTGQQVWASGSKPYFGYLAEPAGSHLVIGFASVDGTLGDAYLIGPGGTAVLLPAGIVAAVAY